MYNHNDNTYHVNNLLPPRTPSAKAILGNEKQLGLMDTALIKFVLANDDYDDASDALGLTGQVSDLWRKIVKLKASVIDKKKLNGETEEQLLKDLFGHVLLAMYYKSKQAQRRSWLNEPTGKAPSDEEWGPNPFEQQPDQQPKKMSEEVKQEIRDGILGKYDEPEQPSPISHIAAARNNPTRLAVEMAEQMTDASWDRQDFDVFHATLAQAYHSINRTRLMPYAENYFNAEMPSND